MTKYIYTQQKARQLITILGLAILLPAYAIANESSVSLGRGDVRDVTLLFTNDIESTFDPIPAFWRDDINRIGGMAELATLIEKIRSEEELVFLFDGGDMYTGSLSKATEGHAPIEMMNSMGYDAKAIGDHEFEYGWEAFSFTKNRMHTPNLAANIYYKDTKIPFAQPYTIIERDGFRIGVIGITGLVAYTVIVPKHRDGIELVDPKPVIKRLVTFLRPDVDLIVLLTHAGKTAPMQTDDEAHPELTRDLTTNLELAGVIDGIDVLIGGHSDAGTREPVIHPKTGTIIMETYGQGTTLGKISLTVDTEQQKILSYSGELLPVISDELIPHKDVARKLKYYRNIHSELDEVIGYSANYMNRSYLAESDIGNFLTDVLRNETGAQIGFFGSGGIRRDISQGNITLANIRDVYPFSGHIETFRMTGQQVLKILEQSLTLERGMMQVSGVQVQYDLNKEKGGRIVSVKVDGVPIRKEQVYLVTTTEFFGLGGDLYSGFLDADKTGKQWPKFSEVLENYVRKVKRIDLPIRGRLVPVEN